MHVQLIAKRESNMTGTLRYVSDLNQGFKNIGLHAELTFPNRTTPPASIDMVLKNGGIDLETFFANYPLRASLNEADIYHLTGQMLATLLLFQRFPKPVVISVHDIIPYLVKNQPKMNTFRHPGEQLFYQLALMGLPRADRLIAISNYTRQTLIEALKLPADRIQVVYPGVDLNKFRTMKVPGAFWTKYGLDEGGRYILFVGSEDPRKNLATLIQSFARVRQFMPDVKLLKVGPAYFTEERQNLQALVTKLGLRKEVIFFNYVPDEDLPYFYNASETLVMPSLYEGFGLPVVEAMACGTPIVSSRAGSLPEVMGEAGIYVDATDHQNMADTLLMLLDNPKEKVWMKEAGKQQAAKFTMDRTALATREIYAEMLSNVRKKNQSDALRFREKILTGPSTKKKMKVALIVPSYPSIHCGVSTYSNYLVSELGKLADVEVVCRLSQSSPLSILKAVENGIKSADIIHVQHAFDLYGYMGYLTFPLYRFLKKSGKLVVTTIHELPDLKPKALKMRLASIYLRSCVREIVRNSDAVLSHTHASLDLFNEWRLTKGTHLIPHGTINQKIVAKSNSSSDNPSIGFFGFITENKGVHRLLDALVDLPSARLMIAGKPRTNRDQIYLAALKAKTANLGVSERVEFLGFLPERAMPNFFQVCDLIVFPYSSCTASGALHLALAHGSVVLTSNLPVFHELKVRYDCLEEFDLRKPDDLANQIKRLLIDESRRTELVAGCQRMIDDTSWQEIAQKTYAVYQKLLEVNN